MHRRLNVSYRLVRTSSIVLLVAAASGASRAPAQGTPARVTLIAGTVIGPNSVVVSGALIEVRSQQTGATHSTKANTQGAYRIIFNDSSVTFSVSVKANGYFAWRGDVSRAFTDDRIVQNVTLKAGGTAADWPAAPPTTPALRFDRTQLGAADAIDVTVDVGDIAVVATTTDRIVYHAYPRSIIPGDDTSWTLPAEMPPAGAYSFGPGGLSITAGGGTAMMLEVPRDLKSLKLTITNQGAVNVSGFTGELSIQSASGPVSLNQVAGPTVVEARDGRITAGIATLPAAMNFLGRNGNITLTAPADARASLAAEVHRGTITLDSTSHLVFPAGRFRPSDVETFRTRVPPADNASKLRWVLNGGGAAITLVSLNGNIIIRRALPKQP